MPMILDMAPGDELIVTGNVRIVFKEKSGARAKLCVIPEGLEDRFERIKAGQSNGREEPPVFSSRAQDDNVG